ncbi:MCL1 protein, partial [Polyodon spathula]|nr:induced myeloid leukemia cell differentiation protein Mcl-1b [Polyodon spathula]MBN3271795.1 MCL1 protein [Polyodon spathula]
MSLTLLGLKRTSPNSVVQLNLCCGNGGPGGYAHLLPERSAGADAGTRGEPELVRGLAEKPEEPHRSDEPDSCPARTSKPARIACKAKGLPGFPLSTNEDGSLPSSPDTPVCGGVPGFEEPRPGGRLARETRAIIGEYLRGYAGLPAAARSRSEPLETLRRVADGVIEKHQYAFNGMINKLNVGQKTEVDFVTGVAESLFSDGTTNWGRVVSLVAFGAVVAKHLKQSGLEHCIEPLGERISSFLLRDKSEWMLNNGAWEGFVNFFHVEDTESSVRNALMTFAGLAGIGAGIALLMR